MAKPRSSKPQLRFSTTWWYLIPALALYTFVVLVPSVRGFIEAFTDWDGLSEGRNFIGFDNFVQITQDPVALQTIGQTITIAIALTILQNGIGLLLALGIKTRIKSQRILRLVFFAPAVVTPILTAYLWKYILSPGGALDLGLEATGLGFLQQDWLGDRDLALWCVIGVLVWQFSGYSMLIFLAGLEGIPEETLEAAAVDGAGTFKRFFYITLPMLAPAIIVNTMLTLVGGLKQFDVVWVLTNGGPANSTQTLSTLIYKNAFQFSEYGYSIALAVVLTAIAVPISLLQQRIAQRGRTVA